MEVDRRVTGITVGSRWRFAVLRSEALEAGRRLNQRAVHREMLIREQSPRVGPADHLIKELLPDLVLEQALAVLGEDGGVETRLDRVHVDEPAEQQVVLQLLAEGPLGSDR